jgi:hypothetical protein
MNTSHNVSSRDCDQSDPRSSVSQGRSALPLTRSLVLLASLVLPAALSGQVAPAPSASAAAAEETIRLNPFEVSEAVDDSFSTQSVGTGGRLVIDMKDMPAQYSVINRAFIDALGITNLEEAASWAPGQSFSPESSLGSSVGTFGRFQQRGQTTLLTADTGSVSSASTGTQRNFFQNSAAGTQDSYAIETFDFGQGANGILFGSGGASGAFNGGSGGLSGVSSVQTKRARLDAPKTTIGVEVGAWDYRRVTIDYNRPITERIGVRINAVDSDAHGYKDHYEDQRRGMQITSTYRLSKTAELSIEASYDKTNVNSPQMPNENMSGWDGRTVARGLIDSTMIPGTQNNSGGLTKSYGQILGTTTPLNWGGEANGVERFNGVGNNANAYHWDLGTNTIMNTRGTLVSRRANATSRTPLWSSTAPNGQFFVQGTRPQTTTSFGVNGNQDVGFGVSNRSWLNMAGLPLDMYNRVAASSRFRMFGIRENLGWEGPATESRSRDLQFSFSQRIGNNFAFGLGGDWNRVQRDGRIMGRNVNTVRLDLNQTLPDGSPNPHYLEMFSSSGTDGIGSQSSITVDQALRVNFGYVLKAGKWGNYNFNLNGNVSARYVDQGLRRLVIDSAPNDPALSTLLRDPRAGVANAAVRMMIYDSYDKGYREPRTPTALTLINSQWTGTGTEGDTNAFVPTVTKSDIVTRWTYAVGNTPVGNASAVNSTFQSRNLALQTTAKWWEDKIVFVGGYRRDYNSNITRHVVPAQYFPSIDTISRPGGLVVPEGRWDGVTRYFKPLFNGTAQQYFALSYRPRNGSGAQVGSARLAATRPTTTLPGGKDGGNLNGSFVVMDPRYASDIFRDDFSPPKIKEYGSTKTYGVTYNVTPWLAPYINRSTAILPTSPSSANSTTPNVNLFGGLLPTTVAESTDFGARFNFLGGKLSGKYNYYSSTRFDDPSGNGVITQMNNLINANRWDDTDAASGATSGINQLGIAPLNANGDVSDTGNFGWEAEISAQIIPGLRLTLNGGASSNFEEQSTAYRLTRQYMTTPDRIAEFKALLEDAGASLDTTQKPVSNGQPVKSAPGLAVLVPLPGKGIGLDSTSAVNAYNNLWIQYEQLGTAATRSRNTPTANFFADYRVQSGAAKGLQIGAGVQWQGPTSIGNKGNWTVLANDPVLGQVAIDDPSVNTNDLIWRTGAMRTQANLSYTFQLKNNRTLALALRINNIVTKPILYGTVSRQPTGDLTKPNRVTLISGNPTTVNDPMNARLTATYTFGGGARGR